MNITEEIKEKSETIVKNLSKLNREMNNNKQKYYAVVLYETEKNMHVSDNDRKFICIGTTILKDGAAALNIYANTPNPASQLIEGETYDDLVKNIEQMNKNYQDEEWLNKFLFPYL